MQSTPKRVLFLCNNTSTIQAVRVTEIIVRGANRDKNSLLRGVGCARPSRASDALREGYGATHSWDIKDMGSLKIVSLSFSSDHWAHEVIVKFVASWEV